MNRQKKYPQRNSTNGQARKNLCVTTPPYLVETFDFIIVDNVTAVSLQPVETSAGLFRCQFNWSNLPRRINAPSAFLMKNIVAEYTYEQSVADGVNVGYDVYTIETEITQKGAEVKAKQWVDHRDRATRKRWAETEEDIAYSGKALDKSVVNVSQIRQVISAMKTAVETQIFPSAHAKSSLKIAR